MNDIVKRNTRKRSLEGKREFSVGHVVFEIVEAGHMDVAAGVVLKVETVWLDGTSTGGGVRGGQNRGQVGQHLEGLVVERNFLIRIKPN